MTLSAEQVLGAVPAAVFVIDAAGSISFATPRAAALVGRDPTELRGRSVLSFVSEETAWAYAAAVAMATDYPDVTMGPMRVVLTADEGETAIRADLWATNHLDDPDLAGIVCLLTEETTAVWLGEAVEATATGASRSIVVRHVVTAMRGQPVNADAVLLADTPEGLRPRYGTDLPAELVVDTDDAPWRVAMRTGVRQLPADLADLPDELRGPATTAGFRTVWAEPVTDADGNTVAVLAMWRRRPGTPSPNQLSSIFQGTSILRLAWSVSTDGDRPS